ncbi:MAG TPA: serine hydrolase, partial [Thermoanaerobaculia bacterium]|nr:serine hydrolase [Thermoanaerobaculia bacterium]
WRIPGASVAIVKDDRIVYVKAYGTKEIGRNDPVTPDTLFHIGSTTKAFTTTAMAMLVDEKKMAWDDAVHKYVEYFRLADPCADSLVTLRDITSHRTGLSRHDELWDNSPSGREQIIRSIGAVKLTKPFRSAYQYQNIMFLTAGEAVGAAAKMPWETFVRMRIFEPLGMSKTQTSIAGWNASEHALGYRWNKTTYRAVPQTLLDDDNIAPAGAIKSSARDMAQWVRFQLAGGIAGGKRLVSSEALDETKTPQMVIRLEGMSRDANPETNLEAYGLGWTIQDYAGALLVSHGGALNGFRAHVDLLPAQHAGFVVLDNLGRSIALVAIRNSLLDLLLGHPTRDWNAYYLAIEKTADDRDEAKRREREATRHLGTKPSRDLADYAGDYDSIAYGTAHIALENGALLLRWNRLAVPLNHFHFDTFSIRSEADDIDEHITFRLGADGDVKTMTFFEEEFVKKPTR